ncbi:hypothetical protein [Deinococcus peraridilitoris]|uniref:hypothetical protein n=1 Tax=Deinococcus peraridilitoris TaxID=432329 RepID=UPI0002E7C4BA|nr:hypothetical protein [Deinococcus peraridilitoris]
MTWLRRRNALWERLRAAETSSPEFEETLDELQALIHWPRERILAGLGFPGETPGPTTDRSDS